MKVAMIGQKGLPARFGGVERHVEGLSAELTARGFDVTVYARRWYTAADLSTPVGVQVVHLPTIHTKHLDAIVHTFLATLHAVTHGFDVIHYHGVGPALLSWIPRVFSPRTRVVTTFHSIDRKHKKWGALARLVLKIGEWSACRFAHQTIAVSRTIRQYARDVYDRDAVYIPNASPLPTPATATDALAEWGVEPQKYVLLVSRLVAHKGFQYVIEAWKRLVADAPELVQDKKLVIVGDGYYTDAYVDMLHTLAYDTQSIVFTGSQNGDALAQLYSHALAFIHPSENEGLPLVVLEAMSYSLPVFLSDIPEHRDIMTSEDRLFAVGSVEASQQALQSILSLSPEERAVEGAAHRHVIEREYQWACVVDSIINVYRHQSPPMPVAATKQISA